MSALSNATLRNLPAGREQTALQHLVPLRDMLHLRDLYHQSALLEQIRSVLQKSVWSAGMGFFREKVGEGKFRNRGHRVPWHPPPVHRY